MNRSNQPYFQKKTSNIFTVFTNIGKDLLLKVDADISTSGFQRFQGTKNTRVSDVKFNATKQRIENAIAKPVKARDKKDKNMEYFVTQPEMV